jgi:hypothetical protein
MAQIPDRVQELVERLKEGKQPHRQSPRKILKWFNASRRGEKITAEIIDAFRLTGLRTDPDFVDAHIDGPLMFLLVESESAGDPLISLSEPTQGGESGQAEQSHAATTDDTSLDQLEGEPEDDEESPHAPIEEEVTVLSQSDWTISTLDEKYKKGKLNLQPTYQREYVWQTRPELPSRLIESLLLEIPNSATVFREDGGR